MSTAVKPVQLQVNTTGAWRDVVGFDAANDFECDDVMLAAATLGKVAKAAFRVVAKNLESPRSPTVLMFWSEETGWQERKWPPR